LTTTNTAAFGKYVQVHEEVDSSFSPSTYAPPEMNKGKILLEPT